MLYLVEADRIWMEVWPSTHDRLQYSIKNLTDIIYVFSNVHIVFVVHALFS